MELAIKKQGTIHKILGTIKYFSSIYSFEQGYTRLPIRKSNYILLDPIVFHASNENEHGLTFYH